MAKNTSPVKEAVILFDFPEAISRIRDFHEIKISKREWKDTEYYLHLVDGKLHIHKPDGISYPLIVSDGDISGKDYFEVIE